MTKHLLIFFLLIFSFTNISMVSCIAASKEEIIGGVIQRTVKNVNNLGISCPLYLIGTGGSIDHKTGKKKTMSIHFEMDHPLSKEQCRWLIVKISELFLTNINNDPGFTQYLPENKFTYQNLSISVIFFTTDHSPLFHPDIEVTSLDEGVIRYATCDPQDVNGYMPYKEIVYESYEEALKIVQTQKSIPQ